MRYPLSNTKCSTQGRAISFLRSSPFFPGQSHFWVDFFVWPFLSVQDSSALMIRRLVLVACLGTALAQALVEQPAEAETYTSDSGAACPSHLRTRSVLLSCHSPLV